MRRVRRRLCNVAAALSLGLCVATAALWVRSYRASDLVHFTTPGRWFYVNACRGTFTAGTWLKAEHNPSSLSPGWQGLPVKSIEWINPNDERKPRRLWRFAGFAYVEPGPGGRLISHRKVYGPLWSFCIGWSILPAVWVWRWRSKAGRLQTGLCPTCGYDLRATPERCPECGTAC